MHDPARFGDASRDHSRILVFTATYNEKDNIAALVQRVLDLPVRCDLVVVDDNSPDGTGDLLDRLADIHDRLTVLHRPRKLGLGTAHKLAMLYAVKHGYDVLVTMDADFSHSPETIPQLIDRLGDVDFVIGSRYMPGGTCDYSGYRRNISVFANTLARNLLGIRLHEFTTSFRAFRVAMLRDVDFVRIRSQGYSFFMETVWHIARAGHAYAEVPIHFVDRIHGVSKIPRHEIVNGARHLLELCFRRLRRWYRPKRRSQAVEEPCYLCGSDMVAELFPARGENTQEAAAYRCTSLGHDAKPQVVQCLACGLAMAGRAYVPDDPVALYAAVEDETYLRNEGARRKTFRSVFNDIARYLPRSGRMLEIGAYCGLFLQEAQARGWDAEGIELSAWAVEQARARGQRMRQGTLADAADDLPGSYDAVVMWDVLEHLADPMAELRRIRPLLADDGVLCLSTLDMSAWLPRLLGRHWPWIMDMHLFYFTTAGLRDMFARAGFTLIEAGPYRHYASLRYVMLKVSTMLPTPFSAPVRWLSRLAPSTLYLPFYFGDVKLYVLRKAADEVEPSARPVGYQLHEVTVGKATGA